MIPGRQSRALQTQHRAPDVPSEVSTVYTGSPAAERALALAARIARRNQSTLTVIIWREGRPRQSEEKRLRNHVADLLAEQPQYVMSLVGEPRAALPRAMKQGQQRVFVMPDEFVSILCEMDSPVLVVR